MVRFTDLHRVYLQALLSRRFISETVALELYKRAVSAVRGESIPRSSRAISHTIFIEVKGNGYEPPFSVSRKGLQSFVDEIGEGIAELGLQVTVTRDETKEGRLWICLVRSVSNVPFGLALICNSRSTQTALQTQMKSRKWHQIFRLWRSATTGV